MIHPINIIFNYMFRKEMLILLIIFSCINLIGVVQATNFSVCNSTCDFNSIQEAVDASDVNGTIIVMNGTYKENVDVAKSLTISGMGDNTTFLLANDTRRDIFRITSDYVNITGLTIKGTGYSGIFLGGVKNCKISDNYLLNIENGIIIHSSSDSLIINNTISANENYGILLEWSDNNIMENNTISLNSGNGIHMRSSNSNIIQNNIAYSNGDSGIFVENSIDNLVERNSLKENEKNDISVSVDLDTHCNNIILNNTGSGDYPIMYSSNNYSITDEILSELILCNADYSRLSNITIIGSKTKKNNGMYLIRTDFSNLFKINSSYNLNGTSILYSHNNTIRYSNFSENKDFGIYLESSRDNIIINNTIKENYNNDVFISAKTIAYCNNKLEGIVGSGNNLIKFFNTSTNLSDQILSQLILCNADSSNIKNVEIKGSSGKNNNGLFIIRTDNSIFSRITSLNNRYGFYIQSSNNNSIRRSNFSSNEMGIYSAYSKYNLIYDNIINNSLNYLEFSDKEENFWNITSIFGMNIMGGPYLGGNFWALPNGSGFSDTCDEFDYDGICDSGYISPEGIVDYLPLAYYEESPGGSDNGNGDGQPVGGRVTIPPLQMEFRVFLRSITQYNTGVFNFSEKKSPIITYINVTVNKNVTIFTMYMKYFSSRPGEVEEVVGDVYRYFEIKPSSNIKKSHIENGTFRFRVSKEWLSENNIPKTNVFMKRYDSTKSGVKWEVLNIRFDVNASTGKVFESDEFIHYVADSPGFSFFVIGGTTYTPPGVKPIYYPTIYPVSRTGVVNNGSDKTNGTIIVDLGNKTIDAPKETYWYLNLPNIINCPDTNFLCNSTEYWFEGEYGRTAINQNLMFRFDLEPNVTTGRILVQTEETKGDWTVFVNGKEMGKLEDGLTNTSINIPKITSSVLYVSLTKAGEGSEIKFKRIHFDPNGGEPEEEPERSYTGLAILGVTLLLILGGSGFYYWKYVKK